MKTTERDEDCLMGASIADVLRLLGAGATGPILMALGRGPLRTMDLTRGIPGYAPRTIYRYADKLAALKVVEREEEPGVPSKVVLTLSEPCGTDLYRLVNRFTDASLDRLPDGRVDVRAWASLGLLGDLWESGMIEELSYKPHSPTELVRGPHEFSYHQINRRVGLFKAGGLVNDRPGGGRRRCYELTKRTRRKMGLITAIARWRRDNVVGGGEGMTAAEMATVLRAALPLAHLPEHVRKCLNLSVHSSKEAIGAPDEEVWARVAEDGAVSSCESPPEESSGRARGQVVDWIPALLDGDPKKVLAENDEQLARDALDSLYKGIWVSTSLRAARA